MPTRCYAPSTLTVLLLFAAAPCVQAQPHDARARDLAATCANCHGTAGRTQAPVPALAGMRKGDIVQRMNEFRDGKRPATIMHQIAKGYTAEQVEAVAAWFERQKP